MKKMLTFFISTFVIIPLLWGQSAVAPSAGDGSSGSPYQIATWQNLYWISQNSSEWDKYYIQTASINFSDADPAINTWDTNQGWTPIGVDITNSFTGSYNGQGYEIYNVWANRPNTNNVGLFGHVGNSSATTTIQNVHVRNTTIAGARGSGSLVGRVTGNSNTLIKRCSTFGGSVTGDGATGGLVGSNNSYVENPSNLDAHPRIEECYANIDVYFSGNESAGKDKIGGLTGCNEKGWIKNSYACGDVLTGTGSGTTRVGGLAGCILIRGYIDHSYSTGAVSGGTYVGGCVGRGGAGGSDGTTESCFWDTETSGQATSSPTSGCTGKSTADMKIHTTFTDAGWDFEIETANGTNNYWDMDYSTVINDGYPFLSWQNGGDVSLPVELSAFFAHGQGSSVILEWTTESETDNLGYILERSNDGQRWTTIASFRTHQELCSRGNTSSRTVYTFTDHQVAQDQGYYYRLADVSIAGVVKWYAPLYVQSNALPNTTIMENAYPNPFNPQTCITYHLAAELDVNIIVYDLLGRQVRALYSGKQPAGSYQLYWHGMDDTGMRVASGSYIIRMQTVTETQSQNVMLLK